MTDPRRHFTEIVEARGGSIDLVRAALWVAAEEYPALDVAAYVARLDELAQAARTRLAGARTARERVEGLNQFLFVEQGFRGNRDDYYDPRNSYLNEVLDRRTGIPITLSLVYVEVASRLGLRARGVGFPGHFLARVTAKDDFIVDPFVGAILSERQCRDRLEAVAGPGVELRADHLRDAEPREIVIRLLSNLKQVFVGRRDFDRALACCDRILITAPDAPFELRDRGIVYEQLGCFAAAASDLERFLELAPGDESADAVEQRLSAVRLQIGRLH